jgi:aspartate/methionine/tyrosine aminotransferase
MVKMSCEQHDALAAGSQFVTHLTGRMLAKLSPQPSAIDTNGFKALLKLVENTCQDSFDLFYALYAHNPNSSEQLAQVAEAFEQVRNDLLTFQSGNGSSSSSSHGAPTAIQLSKLVGGLKESKTVAVSDKAAALKLEGKKIVSLSVGEPDILPAPPVMAAAHAALDAGHVKYTANSGIRPLQEAICEYLLTKGLTYKPNQIVVSNGGKQSLLQAMLAICGPGDQVLIPAPYWVSYTEIAYMSGAETKVISTRASDGYCLMPADLEAAITPRTKVLVLCNPSNPTGAVHPARLLEELAAVLRRHPHVVIFADEIYEQITFDEPFVPFASLAGMYERTVTLNGFSKGPAMTGFRLGYLAAPVHVAGACAKVQSQNTSCPCSISQYAGIAALRQVIIPDDPLITPDDPLITPDDPLITPGIAALRQATPEWLASAVAGYRQKRDYTLQRLRQMPHVEHVYTPEGAFYAFPTIKACFGRVTAKGVQLADSNDVCLYLLEDFLLALVPGEAFGDPDCLRISYAASMETIADAMDKMEQGMKALT